MAYNFPHGVNAAAARATEDPRLRVHNPFAISQQLTSPQISPLQQVASQQSPFMTTHHSGPEFGHGSPERGSANSQRQRSRDRGRERSATRTSSPRTPRASVEQEVQNEDLEYLPLSWRPGDQPL